MVLGRYLRWLVETGQRYVNGFWGYRPTKRELRTAYTAKLSLAVLA